MGQVKLRWSDEPTHDRMTDHGHWQQETWRSTSAVPASRQRRPLTTIHPHLHWLLWTGCLMSQWATGSNVAATQTHQDCHRVLTTEMTCSMLGMTHSSQHWLSTRYDPLLEDLCLLLQMPALSQPWRRHCQCSQCYCWPVTTDTMMKLMTGNHHTLMATNAGAMRNLRSHYGVSMTADLDQFESRVTSLGVHHCHGHCWLSQPADHAFHHRHVLQMMKTDGCVHVWWPCLVVEQRSHTADTGMVFHQCEFSDVLLDDPTARTPKDHHQPATSSDETLHLDTNDWFRRILHQTLM